ncbi:hypothetical protein AB0I16_19210 [Streptomyces sp. NPDC050703]|uniref:hypothetical protein n=1 Tax=Streptomyces sp. NPDC050703 TaxID=3157218 RepID=UPI003429176C
MATEPRRTEPDLPDPQTFELLIVPEFTDEDGTETADTRGTLRSAVVRATGETGASGYPRYTGDGMEADIDPVSRAVEALLVDGAELDYGLMVRVADHLGG